MSRKQNLCLSFSGKRSGGAKDDGRYQKTNDPWSRCDISLALHTGAKTIFFSREECLESHFPYSDKMNLPGKPISIFEDLDDNIATSWGIMQRFCSLVNLAAEAGGKIPWEMLLSTMKSVVYRLLYVTFDAGSVNEAVRLGLLVLSTQILLQWKLLKIKHAHLTASYRSCLDRLRSLNGISSRLVVWLLMIGAISVFEQHDDSWLKPWLGANIRTYGIISWKEMQKILDSFIWVPLVQEKPGKEVFDSIVIQKS